MAERYLVTGGTGFIGAALVRRLTEDGRQVRVVDNDLRGSRARLANLEGDYEMVVADVRNEAAMAEAGRDVDVIVHLAALNGTANFYRRPELVLDIGIRGMYGALAAARANDIRTFVLASSSEAYQTPPVIPTPEEVPLTIPDPWNPRYSYGGGKLVSEIMLANFHRDLFERAVIVRPHNVYGPDMGWDHVLPQLILRAHDATAATPDGPIPFEIQGDGSQTRAFVHIDDFIDGLMLAIDRGAHRTVYHVGADEEATIAEVVDELFRYFGRTPRLIPTPAPAGGTPRRCPDIGRMRALGYEPRRSLRDGIAATADWYVANAHRRPDASA